VATILITILRINWPNLSLWPFLYLCPGLCLGASPASTDAICAR